MADARTQRNDAILSVSLMLLISAAIMAAAAGTLHAEGIGLSKAAQMISLLEPLAGPFAVSLFAVGIIAAGVSSQFPNVLMLPWLLCDYTETAREMTLPKYRIMVFLISLLGLVVPFFGGRPVLVMIASQSFNAVILPITVACILYLTNRQDLMGAHKNKPVANLILLAILSFSVATSFIALRGVWQLVTG